MESFVNALGATGIDQVVEQYFPLFLGIDKRIINFSNQALDYLKKGESHRYSSWLSGVFQILLKKKDLTLDEAVMTRGDLYLNSRENDAPFLAAGEKSGIKHCLLLGSYSPDALELMAQFSVADQRNTALEQYARKVLVRIQNQEQKTVDNLLGSYPGKDSSRDLGDGIGNDDGSGKTNTKTKNDLGSKDSGSKDSLLNLLEKEK
jgi:hypothetical protein